MGFRNGALLAAASVAALTTAFGSGPAAAAEALPTTAELQAAMNGTAKLRRALQVEGIQRHQRELAAYARRNDNNRASGTRGFDESSRYVRRKLAAAGYEVSVQNFSFSLFEETAPPALARVAPDAESFTAGTDFLTLEYSGSGTVAGRLVPTNDILIPPPADASSTSGCEAEDFPAAPGAGAVALVQRGTCDFLVKAQNAVAAGYAAAIVMNEGQPGREEVFNGTLGEEVEIPVVGTSFAVGRELYQNTQAGPVTVSVSVTAETTTRQTRNVLADSPRGRADRVIVVGAHLDSVAEGPGINDNGSGSSTILEMALQIARLNLPLRNKLRFALWGAEESGLIGSTRYVESLSEAELAKIYANLNFDMVGSPNFARFVYDGDGSLTPDDPPLGPPGSAAIERQFQYYFGTQRLASEPTLFDGRSDYGPFIERGIPAGGLFTGAEGIKTPEQARVYGGRAGIAYDPCYHQACDTFSNVNTTALDQMSDAVAFTTMTLANRTTPLAPRPSADAAKVAATATVAGRMDYLGPNLRR